MWDSVKGCEKCSFTADVIDKKDRINQHFYGISKKLVRFIDGFYCSDHPSLSDHGLRWWWCGGRVLSVCVLVLAFSFW